jgi:undecaprenyl phosphate-alpha-L-ara4FN deformylase
VTAENVAERLLAHTAPSTASSPVVNHVFTLHAELEGMRFLPVLEELIQGWRAQGYRLTSMRTLYESLQPLALPRCEVAPGTVPGRTGTVLRQGREFLADVDLAAAA